MDRTPFIGSEARAAGLVRKHQLRSNYRALFPDVYLAVDVPLTFRMRAEAAWLWSRRRGVAAGLTAAGLHGARWVDDGAPVELIHRCGRPPIGVRCHATELPSEERMVVSGIPVTTPERTAFDLGRRGRRVNAVARLDALVRATGLDLLDVASLAARHPGTRGLRQLERVLPLVDPGAQSPRETWLRLVLLDGGLPTPETQIPVFDEEAGYAFAYLDMGWPDLMIAVEYDGDHHRTDRRQYVKDIRRTAELERREWAVVRVIAEDCPRDIVRRVRAVIVQRSRATLH